MQLPSSVLGFHTEILFSLQSCDEGNIMILLILPVFVGRIHEPLSNIRIDFKLLLYIEVYEETRD
jgi:hypothetical protein